MFELELEDGKYTIIQNNDPWEFKALRYGEEWRDLTGDNLMLALINHIQDIEIELHAANSVMSKYKMSLS